MNREHLEEAARISRFVAALMACVVLGRFALDATTWATQRGKDAREAQNRKDVDRGDEDTVARKLVSEAQKDNGQKRDVMGVKPEDALRTGSPAPEADGGTGTPKRRTLLVDLGRPRSDVYVNGVLVGRTPYAGTWSCRDGSDVHIVVMGSGSSAPIEARAHCGPSIVADESSDKRKLDDKAVDEILGDQKVGAALKDALRSRAQ